MKAVRFELHRRAGGRSRDRRSRRSDAPELVAMEGCLMEGSITARTPDYLGWLVAASVGALLSAVVTAICVKYEERGLAWVWAAAFFSCALAAAYCLGKLL